MLCDVNPGPEGMPLQFRLCLMICLALPLPGCGAFRHAMMPPVPTAEARVATQDVDSRRISGVHVSVVTTHAGREVTGAACRFSSPEIDVSFTTPTHVKLPVFKQPLPPADLTCTKGALSFRQTVHAQKVLEQHDKPDGHVGFFLASVSDLLAEALNLWSYYPQDAVLRIDLN